MENRELVRNVIHEIRDAYERPPFTPTPDIDLVWVVSLPGTVFTPSDDGMYRGRVADREIVDAGVHIVLQITALCLHKNPEEISKEDVERAGPTFFYNGEDKTNGRYAQIEDFEVLVATTEFPIPQAKVSIRHLTDESNTPGQVKNIAQFLRQNPQFKNIAVVARVHHQRRVARYLKHYIQLFPPDVNLLDASVPETQDIVGTTLREARRIVKYAKKGDLAEEPYF
ncbi:hypothetical protein HY409_00830 [Candidatus Gottesmanbacteria bacterium]|nr:hypothetical protein [Candidatus Gottesmanbacteria bacterium]